MRFGPGPRLVLSSWAAEQNRKAPYSRKIFTECYKNQMKVTWGNAVRQKWSARSRLPSLGICCTLLCQHKPARKNGFCGSVPLWLFLCLVPLKSPHKPWSLEECIFKQVSLNKKKKNTEKCKTPLSSCQRCPFFLESWWIHKLVTTDLLCSTDQSALVSLTPSSPKHEGHL